jgi:hypothetical protein
MKQDLEQFRFFELGFLLGQDVCVAVTIGKFGHIGTIGPDSD